jgi:hypothetical protein
MNNKYDNIRFMALLAWWETARNITRNAAKVHAYYDVTM